MKYIVGVTAKELWQCFEMGTEGEKCIRTKPRFLACGTGVMMVVPVTEIQRVEIMRFIWTILSLRNL